jgi:2-C-methyl-D-erythritol 2,4-cyclodiphosphate synthase
VVFRVGLGYDVHRLVPGRRLILGGVEIPFGLGLEGHSDGDVLLHAIMDACLGAAGLGDIGVYFPSEDETLRGISSLELLGRVRDLVRSAGFRPASIDAVVIAEAPKLAPYFGEMKAKVARTLGIDADIVGLKATTNEGLGFLGRGEGIAALAVVLLEAAG